jgi:hypothetical protein
MNNNIQWQCYVMELGLIILLNHLMNSRGRIGAEFFFGAIPDRVQIHSKFGPKFSYTVLEHE